MSCDNAHANSFKDLSVHMGVFTTIDIENTWVFSRVKPFCCINTIINGSSFCLGWDWKQNCIFS